jgi:signal transduction histidine kinase
LAICAVIGTIVVANFTVVSQTNAVLTGQETNETRAAALGAAVAYQQGARPGDSWRLALSPVIAIADRTGAAMQVRGLGRADRPVSVRRAMSVLQTRDPGGPVVRSSPGFASFPPGPVMESPVLVGSRLVGSVILKFDDHGIGRIIGHFASERWGARLIAGGVGVVLAVILAFIVTPMVVGPVDRLTAAARARGRGQMQVRVGHVRGLRGLRELVRAYDSMADAVDGQDQIRRNHVAYMAHELRTPIAVVQASTEAMTDRVVDVSPDQIESLHAEAAKLSGLVDRLQRMAATEAAYTGLELETADLAVIAGTVADSLDSVFRKAQIEVRQHLDSVSVLGDPRGMREIVTNLLTNAAKFTPSGGQISLETYASDDVAVLEVSDTGPGIPPEELPLVAKRFYRSRNTADVPGSGLGLAIVDELARAHGGTMTITSQLGEGTNVTIQMPRPIVSQDRPEQPRRRFTGGSPRSGSVISGTGDGGDGA